jgi:hypothetical protein
MGISSYSTTPGSNTAINGINIAEGCAPSGINDAIRQLMADIASGASIYQKPTVSGTANAIVLTLTPALTSNVAGQFFIFAPTADNTAAATINWGGGVISITKWGAIALVANDILSGVPAAVWYDGTQAILINPQTNTQGATIASAGTINLDTATGDYNHISGVTTITAMTLKQGRERTLVFDGILTLTNGASLILPGGVSITTAAGDAALVRGEASGVVRVINYAKASGLSTVTATTTTTQAARDNSTKFASTAYADNAAVTIPVNSQSAAYTTVLADAGKTIWHPTADNNARTFTIDSNANVAYVVGTAITFINEINTVTIAITADTLVLAGTGSTGSRTLAANGVATAIKVSSTRWYISGTGLT